MKTCTVCRHPDRHQIDKLIALRTPYRQVGRRFGIAKSDLHRHHKHGHCERALRKAAQRLQAADGYLADSIAERMETLSAATMGVLGQAVKRNNLPCALGAIKQARDHLEFEGELTGQLRGGTLQQNNVRLSVTYGSQADRGITCPTCHHVIDAEELENQYRRATKRALGLLPEEGETMPEPATGQNGTGVPAGVDADDDERINGYHINRPDQVIAAEVVPNAVITPPVPKRPALPARQPEANIRVATNTSHFDWKKL
jgi:hypothetical protein